ncbi:MAG TPA: hypothetical protein VN706_17685 [Gemmatimonadaceae bacterium]|nr:hypothetical protein [Gemmatimonadaceae bacterium]
MILIVERDRRVRALQSFFLNRTIDGLTLCRLVRSDPALDDVPVIVFSILAAAIRAKDAGPDP